MREVERIDRIMEGITKYWKANPDMRFGQMLINMGLATDTQPMWNIEDKKWEKHINEVLDENKV